MGMGMRKTAIVAAVVVFALFVPEFSVDDLAAGERMFNALAEGGLSLFRSRRPSGPPPTAGLEIFRMISALRQRAVLYRR